MDHLGDWDLDEEDGGYALMGGPIKKSPSRGSSPKNVIFSNGPKIIFEWSSLIY
jgi:hypothetical protein